jgi:chromosome segregation ATPase
MMAGDARSDDRDGGRDDITRAVSALEASVASLTKRAEAAETRADQAENRAEQAETRADRAEQALSDAQNRVDRAEMGRDAERSPADELRDRIEALRVQLATAEADGSALTIETAELTAQLNQARRQAQEAQEAAEKKPSGGARGLLAGTAPSWAC